MRHELKYLISSASSAFLKSVLAGVLKKDPHYPEGVCKVRSLYFDDLNQKAYHDKIEGNASREKFRIRLYNQNTDYIVFEKKSKFDDLVEKKSVQVKKEIADLAIEGKLNQRTGSKLLSEFRVKRVSEGIFPQIIIEYKRTAFVYPSENTRITIDEDIHFAKSSQIWNNNLPMSSLFLDNCVILEVKFDEIFPPFLSPIISEVPADRLALSKFAMCCEVFDWNNE